MKALNPLKLRLTYSKTGLIRFISHRDLLRLFFRSFTRAKLPVAYSEGFNPHPRVSFCPPLKVGMEGLNELLEMVLIRPVEEDQAVVDLNRVLPPGVRVSGAELLSPDTISLGKAIREVEYQVRLRSPVRVTDREIGSFLSASEARVEYEKDGRIKSVNARRGVLELDLLKTQGNGRTLKMLLSVKENGRPLEVLAALSGAPRALLRALKWQRLGFHGKKGVADFDDRDIL
ncbi:MAG: TIGR03936 family radical SAM-associated protein [Candidatus Euphemobacter frigidus]|nr:TIGR03936 family radical SAM-associated protein [Candidatus Euphemobacter frigidus]MDP8275070.1 TIGR03936 family radical SAM-associated protein [Candidatus Euphemobacter frigidus]